MEIDNLTLIQVNELAGYWREHPPVHLLVAGFMGFQAPPPAEETKLATEEEIMQAVAMFGGVR